MEKFIITLEEIFDHSFEVEAKNAEDALEIAEQKYWNNEFVIPRNNPQFRQIAITDSFPNHESSEWMEFYKKK
jgi:hypothetical protein